ncbi:50S ribosomal protein L31 [Thermorudis peleae]|uniref:50S ribosomal protein L31 n=1 Tax=Thermorudis peleae TaxID=1382356 RepID=UPI000570DA57|nr:50S ribosomal protein L31 [Thermorudis peleae]
MKKDIHPKFYPQATVVCSCGNTWVTGSTKPMIRIELCPRCHPFYTGEQKIVDTGGQVERFMRKLERAQAEQPRKKKQERRQRRLSQRMQLEREALLTAPDEEATSSEAER